jgi:hypothetical protein
MHCCVTAGTPCCVTAGTSAGTVLATKAMSGRTGLSRNQQQSQQVSEPAAEVTAGKRYAQEPTARRRDHVIRTAPHAMSAQHSAECGRSIPLGSRQGRAPIYSAPTVRIQGPRPRPRPPPTHPSSQPPVRHLASRMWGPRRLLAGVDQEGAGQGPATSTSHGMVAQELRYRRPHPKRTAGRGGWGNPCAAGWSGCCPRLVPAQAAICCACVLGCTWMHWEIS